MDGPGLIVWLRKIGLFGPLGSGRAWWRGHAKTGNPEAARCIEFTDRDEIESLRLALATRNALTTHVIGHA
jgi:hypothetical protein